MKIKNKVLALVCLTLAFALPTMLFAAPKKKRGKNADSEITCVEIWKKKPEDYVGKEVKTFVLDIADPGEVMSDAPAAVVPIKTGDKNQDDGGNVLVVVPTGEFSSFCAKFVPDAGGESSSFGGKIEYKKLAARLGTVNDEPVLFFNIKPEELKDFSPRDALDKQRGNEKSDKSSRDGFQKKYFYISKIKANKKPYTRAEFKRLIGLYNKAQKNKDDRVKEADVLFDAEDDEFSMTVFDEKAKIEWELRK